MHPLVVLDAVMNVVIAGDGDAVTAAAVVVFIPPRYTPYSAAVISIAD